MSIETSSGKPRWFGLEAKAAERRLAAFGGLAITLTIALKQDRHDEE